jgi:1-acyl-sn-glycerol-3-phosphate acyltransferase
MGRRERFFLGLQYLLGRIAVVATAPLYFLFMRLMGYRIRDLKRVRKEIRQMYREHEGPWIICPNHLTMIDSIVLSYGMISLADHVFRFQRVPWNLPERKNFQKSILLAVLCYLSKCLPVDRGGSREELQRLMDKCRSVLGRRQHLLIFPEGGRSRTGRVKRENYSYGVGRFIEECDRCRVMLIYLRGDGQETYSLMPKFGERFTMVAEVFDPGKEGESGLRIQREYARRIMERLAAMEDSCLASAG